MPFCDQSQSHAVIRLKLGTWVLSNQIYKPVNEELAKWRASEQFDSRFLVG